MKYFFIYKVTNILNQKVYIGQSVNPRSRWRRHQSDAKLGKDKKHFARAIRKYGSHNFIVEVIVQSKSLEDIDQAEIDCIKQYRSSDNNYGYNIALGGNGKRIVSEETKKKISKIRTGQQATEETKNRMSRSMLGKNKGTNNGMFGKKPSHAKLTQKQALDVRAKYLEGTFSMQNLADMFDVSKKTILNIIRNRVYIERT
jgi:group I intron endonuclease